jgi:hypothetical protein
VSESGFAIDSGVAMRKKLAGHFGPCQYQFLINLGLGADPSVRGEGL